MTFVDYPGHFIAVVLLLIFVGLTALTWRTKKLQTAAAWRLLLAGVQYAAIVILLLIIFNPSKSQTIETTAKNTVLVFFDTSESMSIINDSEQSRLDTAIEVFEDNFTKAREKPNYKIYGFDSAYYNCGSAGSLRRWGSATNLHEPLAVLARYDTMYATRTADDEQGTKSKSVVGAIVFTDGQADDKNINAYLPLQNKDFKVLLAAIGSEDSHPDIAVKLIKAPSRAAVDTTCKIQTVIEAANLRGENIKIELLQDDFTVALKEFTAEQLSKSTTIEFTIPVGSIGRHCISVKVKPLEKEINVANNIRRTIIEVVENTELKVLLYSQVANFDIGKIRSALERDKKIQLDFGLDAVISPELSRSSKKVSGQVELPEERSGFYKYDIIILGPTAMDTLTATQIDGLYSFVVDRGGGLILLPGRARYDITAWENEKIKTLLPVQLAAGDRPAFARFESSASLTLEGLGSKILNQADLARFDSEAIAYYDNFDKKPAASILVTAADKSILCTHRIGRGRVCLLNAVELFRWYREDLDGGLLQKLFSGLTSYLGRVPNVEAGIELFAKRSIDEPYTVVFDAYVYDSQFNLVADATVLLDTEGQTLTMDQAEKGHYTAQTANNRSEAILASVQAQAGGTFLGEKTIAVNLALPKGEMDETAPDRKFLRKLAKRTGAEFVNIEDIDEETTSAFVAVTKQLQSGHMISIWPCWPLLIGLCALLCVNWFIRRSIGLI